MVSMAAKNLIGIGKRFFSSSVLRFFSSERAELKNVILRAGLSL
jgi:hypothetical protein